MTKKNNKFINLKIFFKMEKENVKKEEQQFTAPVENENVAEQQVKKPWYKKTWGKLVIAAAAVGLGVVGTAVAVKKLKGTTNIETATDNAVEVEEQQKETPRDNNSRRERFEARRQQWNNQQ